VSLGLVLRATGLKMLLIDDPDALEKYRPLFVERQANQARPTNHSRKSKGKRTPKKYSPRGERAEGDLSAERLLLRPSALSCSYLACRVCVPRIPHSTEEHTMRRLLTIWIALAAALFASQSYAQLSMMGVGGGGFGSGGGSNLTALDGHSQRTQTGSGTTCAATKRQAQTILYLSTTQPILTAILSAGATFSGGGLTWTTDTLPPTARAKLIPWFAVNASAGPITVTATLPATITYAH
jgi:hypothetical protein